MIQQSVVSEGLNGVRIDKCLAEALAELSRSCLQKLLRPGCALANGKPVEPNCWVDTDSPVKLGVPEMAEPKIVPEKMDLNIIYEDKDVMIVSKPKGMVVHPAAGHYNGTLANGLVEHYKDGLSGINGVMWPGVAHRIDMDIAGPPIVCKNGKVYNEIVRQSKEHSIIRRYRVTIHGVVKEDEGAVDAFIGRHSVGRKKMNINEKDGREAVIHYRVLERFRQPTYIGCRLEMGRTRQVRVHIASTHHPLLGDAVYGPTRCPYKLQRQTPYTGVLGFVHPETGEYMEFEASLSEYFEELLERLRNSRVLRLFYAKYLMSQKGRGNISEALWLALVLKEVIWGGERLPAVFHHDIPCERTGECWVISVYPNGDRVITSGAHAGETLGQLWDEHPELFGNIGRGRFSLLTRVIDAKDDLSIQVHPNDEYTAIHENGPLGRTEYWYVLDCDEDAQIVIGHHTRNHEEVKQMIKGKWWDGSTRAVSIRKGDFLQISPGCLHAIRGGTLIFEIQQDSGIIYWVRNYDRLSDDELRPLHIKQSTDTTEAPSVELGNRLETVEHDGAVQTRSISCDYCIVDRYEVDGTFVFDFEDVLFMNVSMIEGEGTVGGQPAKMGDHPTLSYYHDVYERKGRFTMICTSPSGDGAEQGKYSLTAPTKLSILDLSKSPL